MSDFIAQNILAIEFLHLIAKFWPLCRSDAALGNLQMYLCLKMEINFVKLGVKSKIFLQKQKVTQMNLNTKLSINNRPLP